MRGGSCPAFASSMISFMPLTACFKFGHAGPYDMRSLSMYGDLWKRRRWKGFIIRLVVLALPVGAYLLLRIVGVVPLNPTWDWIAFGAALLLLPCGVFEACGDAPQNRGEALTLACVPSAPCGNQSSRRGHRDNIASMA